MRTRHPGEALLIAAWTLAAGCGSTGQLKVKQIDAAVQSPGNVTVYFTVETKTGEPVAGLESPSFKIFEDGKLVPEKKGKRLLLDPRVGEARFTLVLTDFSGPVVDSEYLPDVVEGAGRLAATAVGRGSEVAISVFDGDPELVPMLGFGSKASREAFDAMRKYRPRTRNSNLYQAVWQGVELLQSKLSGAAAPYRYANLVVFTDRGDMTHKVTADALKKALDLNPTIRVYVIGAGPGINPLELGPLARSGLFTSKEPKDVGKGFTEIGAKIDAVTASRYVLSYCSPKRKGEHKLEIEVDAGEDHDSGKLSYRFSADDFKAGCSPKRRPDFFGEDSHKDESHKKEKEP